MPDLSLNSLKWSAMADPTSRIQYAQRRIASNRFFGHKITLVSCFEIQARCVATAATTIPEEAISLFLAKEFESKNRSSRLLPMA
jgi:hypothetical protein